MSYPIVRSYPPKYGRRNNSESGIYSTHVWTAFCWLGFKLRFRLRGKEYVTRGHIGQIKMVAKATSRIRLKDKYRSTFCVISYKRR